MFEILTYKRRFDANKVELVENCGHPYVVRTSCGNGQKGFIDEEEEFLNDGNTISFGQDTATMYYQEVPYFTGDKIKILKSKLSRFNKANAQFFLTSMRNSFQNFSWGSSSFNVSVIANQKIQLPLKENLSGFSNPCDTSGISKIDFDFMESFISELEEERISELNAYLIATNLKDYTLTSEEENALKEFENVEWGEYALPEIFNIKNTHNILSLEIIENSGKIPYLCASAENNGVSSYISYKDEFLEKGNCIFIGGKTFVVSYQKNDFFSNDSHNLALYLKNQTVTRTNQLYLATCIYKSLNHKYSWGDSISGSKIKSDKFQLPTKNGKPDYDSMQTFIKAVEKLVIKDVVLYADKKIEVTKKVVKPTEYKINENAGLMNVAQRF